MSVAGPIRNILQQQDRALLEIKKNRDNYNRRLDALLRGEDDPAGY